MFILIFITLFIISFNTIEAKLPKEAYLKLPQLIAHEGYPVEEHQVTTGDGYILSLARIPYGKKCVRDGGKRGPILLMHGLTSSGMCYVLLGSNQSIAYLLADSCYDVWIGNWRGTSYSQKHVSLSPKNATFWDFSWHELGVYDLPAMIDYTLDTTNHKQLKYVGHSQGCTAFFVCMTMKPEYQKKVKAMVAMAPGVFLEHTKGLVFEAADFAKRMYKEARETNSYIFPSSTLLKTLSTLCSEGFSDVCCNLVFSIVGYDKHQVNKTRLPVILHQVISTTSLKQVIHFYQLVGKDYFRQFDYGEDVNLQKYGSIEPPVYELEKVNVPVAIFYGANDFLVQPMDIHRLASKLPNLIGLFRVPLKDFNHLDFLTANDIYFLLNKNIISCLNQ